MDSNTLALLKNIAIPALALILSFASIFLIKKDSASKRILKLHSVLKNKIFLTMSSGFSDSILSLCRGLTSKQKADANFIFLIKDQVKTVFNNQSPLASDLNAIENLYNKLHITLTVYVYSAIGLFLLAMLYICKLLGINLWNFSNFIGIIFFISFLVFILSIIFFYGLEHFFTKFCSKYGVSEDDVAKN